MVFSQDPVDSSMRGTAYLKYRFNEIVGMIVSSMICHTLPHESLLLCFKPGAHGVDFAEQSATNEAFLSRILTVCGQFLVRNCSFVVVRKISSMFDNFYYE